MELIVPQALAEKIGWAKLEPFEVTEDSFNWKKVAHVNLKRMNDKKIQAFRALLLPYQRSFRGGVSLIKDIDTWLAALKGESKLRARTVRQFATLAHQQIQAVPGHRVFRRNDVHGEAWLCCYVNKVEYRDMTSGHYGSTPERVNIELVWEELGGRREATQTYWAEDCRGLLVSEALARSNIYLETPEMRERYLAEVLRFRALHGEIGRQLLAVGIGTDDLDGNEKRAERGWWWRQTNRFMMERDGVPSRVVVDVFRESDKEEKENRVHLDPWYWDRGKPKTDDDDDEADDDGDALEERPVIEIPLHPYIACFDLRRHTRLRIHVNYLTQYEYNERLADNLILPDEVKSLVEMLLSRKAAYQDIVAGKSGGAIVMCAGEPGTGKTLTAEVYAESRQRPLYSVQASQLGTNPETLEDELLKLFARAQRWNAILLIDEADVYVRERGDDIHQNAIVGVLLRVLEYYNGVLFLTTNRADLIDDAVLSRCMARIDYTKPDAEKRERIWRTLSKAAGLKISEATINKVVRQHPGLSGRDVKMLLKLASMVSEATGKPITSKTIAYVKQFKPTVGVQRSVRFRAR